MTGGLARSRALWNRSRLDLRSDEILAQILDRGSMDDWRELWALARADAALRARVIALIGRVPLPLPRFWLAALALPGEPADLGRSLPVDESGV
ncbi:MAG: hypothetical protein WAT39_26620 [Planctomycetota bacterium]